MMALLRETVLRQREGTLTKTKSEEVQQACGLHYCEHGLLASNTLRAHCSLLGCVRFDWVHTLLQDGVFVLEASLLLQACSEHLEAWLWWLL